MSDTLLEAAKTLVEAEKELRRALLAMREAHRSCATHSYGYCLDSACIDTENALDAAVRAEFEAHKTALVELRKLAETNATTNLWALARGVFVFLLCETEAERCGWERLHCLRCGRTMPDVQLQWDYDGHECIDSNDCWREIEAAKGAER